MFPAMEVSTSIHSFSVDFRIFARFLENPYLRNAPQLSTKVIYSEMEFLTAEILLVAVSETW